MAPYTPGSTVATVTMVMLVLTALTYVVAIFVWIQQVGLLSDIAAGKSVSEDTAKNAEVLALGVTWSGVALRLVTAIPFCIWFARMHRNLPALGAGGLQYTPGWAAGAFFVPIMNWFRPYQIGAEIWNASNPAADPTNPYHWKHLRSASIIGVWWALFLGPGFVDRIVANAFEKSTDPKTLRTATLVAIVLELANLAAAAVTIHMIRKINQRQTQKHQKLEALRLAQPTPYGYPAPLAPTEQ